MRSIILRGLIVLALSSGLYTLGTGTSQAVAPPCEVTLISGQVGTTLVPTCDDPSGSAQDRVYIPITQINGVYEDSVGNAILFESLDPASLAGAQVIDGYLEVVIGTWVNGQDPSQFPKWELRFNTAVTGTTLPDVMGLVQVTSTCSSGSEVQYVSATYKNTSDSTGLPKSVELFVGSNQWGTNSFGAMVIADGQSHTFQGWSPPVATATAWFKIDGVRMNLSPSSFAVPNCDGSTPGTGGITKPSGKVTQLTAGSTRLKVRACARNLGGKVAQAVYNPRKGKTLRVKLTSAFSCTTFVHKKRNGRTATVKVRMEAASGSWAVLDKRRVQFFYGS